MSDEDKPRLLVVDDEPGMRRTLQRIMRAKGFDVLVAEDGPTAIATAREFLPDVLLLDVRMPGIDGVETWRQLKTICPDAAAIFMTAYTSSERLDDARREGALEVMSKPLDIDAVCRRLRQNLRPVLVVDDDAGFRDSLGRALRQLLFRVLTAKDADQAMEHFARHPHCVVLLDMKLDGASGLDVLRQIRSQSEERLVILMSGYSDTQDEMRDGLDNGAVSTLTKPFPLEELVSEIRRHTEASDAL